MADGEEEKKIVLAGAGEDEEDKKPVVARAGDEEENKIVVAGGEENSNRNGNGTGNRFSPPRGFRFKPRDEELVRYYLLPKLQGREHVPNDAIIEDNVYQSHPDTLTEKYKDKGETSWYFLSPRARKYHNGDRPSRSTDDNRGRWKASTGKAVVICDGRGGTTKVSKSCLSKAMMDVAGAGDGKMVYSESGLSYFEGPIKDEIKSKWLMKELTVPGYDKKRGKNAGDRSMLLNQYVMCKIYLTPRRNGEGDDDDDEEDEAGPSATEPEPEESGEGTAAGCEKLSEKQAGKRPAKDQNAGPAPKRAHPHHHPDRLQLGPPAPLHMHPTFRMPGPGYYGAPGRPMGFYPRAPGPRPPMMYNNGQAPAAFNVARQQAATFNGQVPRQQAATFNGQVPRQQAAYNGQMPMPRRQVPYNGQVQVPRQQVGFNANGQLMRAPVLKPSPPYRPAGTPSSSGQNQTMMQRPPCPATGQAVKPPSSAVLRPAQMQRQPETEEMRANRVIQQHMEEYSRIMQSSTRPPASAARAAHQLQRPAAPFTHQQQRQQQRPMMAFTQHQQRPYLGANAGYQYQHHPRAMVPRFSLNNFYASEAAQHYQYQSSRMVPATSGSAGPSTALSSASAESLVSSVVSGAGNGVSGANRDRSNDDEMEFVESATAGGSGSASAADDGDGPKDDSAH